MRRLGASETQLQRWEPELRRVFPDVKEGDSIIGVHYPGRSAAFYHRGRATGEVADAECARRVFAVWRDAGIRSPSPVSFTHLGVYKREATWRRALSDHGDAAGDLLHTAMSGNAEPLASGPLLKAFLRFPLMTLGVVLRIHLSLIHIYGR